MLVFSMLFCLSAFGGPNANLPVWEAMPERESSSPTSSGKMRVLGHRSMEIVPQSDIRDVLIGKIGDQSEIQGQTYGGDIFKALDEAYFLIMNSPCEECPLTAAAQVVKGKGDVTRSYLKGLLRAENTKLELLPENTVPPNKEPASRYWRFKLEVPALSTVHFIAVDRENVREASLYSQ